MPDKFGTGPDGLGEYHETALLLARQADVVFHDAQYTDEELPAKAHLGHSCPGYALNLAVEAEARRLVLYHHDPSRTDQEIDDHVDHYRNAPLPVEAAAEGTVLDLA